MNRLFAFTILILAIIFITFPTKANQNNRKKIDFKKLSTKQKIEKSDLSFAVTFDGSTTVADFAKGEKISTTSKGSLGLRGIPGYDTQNAFKIETGENLRYEAIGNITPSQGTIILWICAQNYAPSDVSPTKPPHFFKPYVLAKLKNSAGDTLTLFIYQYYQLNKAFAYWSYQSKNQKAPTYCVVNISLKDIQKGQWFQIAMTWDDQVLRGYLDGKLSETKKLPVEVEEVKNFSLDTSRSFIAFREGIFPPVSKDEVTLIDDAFIFSRALTENEIRKQYYSVVDSENIEKIPEFTLGINGAPSPDDPNAIVIDMDVDMSGLDNKWLTDFRTKSVTAVYTLKDEQGATIVEQQQPAQISNKVQLKCVKKDVSGKKLTAAIKLADKTGEVKTHEQVISIPTLSFIRNNLGADGKVPSLWPKPRIEPGDKVVVWNRVYKFKNSMLPIQATHSGDDLLSEPVKLNIKTDKGLEEIEYKIESQTEKSDKVVLTGTGQAKSFSLKFQTTIDYDGLIRCDFEIYGKPIVEKMYLTWGVKKAFTTFLMIPQLAEDKERHEFPFPEDGNCRKPYLLWHTSPNKGFCWTPENDANWRYSPDEKIIKSWKTEKGAECQIDMITRKTTIPEGAKYHAMFIATPSRPLPAKSRTLCLYSAGVETDGLRIHPWGNEGMITYTLRPGQDFAKWYSTRPPASTAFLGTARCVGSDDDPTSVFFKNYWEIPGDYVYSIKTRKFDPKLKDPFQGNSFENERSKSIPSCPNCRLVKDYTLDNINQLFSHEYGDRAAMVYYDLCLNSKCDSTRHGCVFEDRFGRKIKNYTIMGMRDLVKRTVNLCHKNDRTVMLHAQNVFNPAIHGLADYWFPGEQFQTYSAEGKPWCYTDSIPDRLYQSEFNMRVLGPALCFLPSLTSYRKDFDKPEYTEAMITQLLLNDIPTSAILCNHEVVYKVWDALKKYKTDQAKAHLYYQQDEITSDNPKIRTTWFECPDEKTLVVIGNKFPTPEKAMINLSNLKNGDFTVLDEYAGKNYNAKDGKLEITIPARSFALIGIKK